MHKLRSNGLRIAGLMLMALATTHCGDNSVTVIGTGDVTPTAGTFLGTTVNGGIVTLLVGSIESAVLVCEGQTFGGACNPVLEVANGTASGTCSGVNIDVTFITETQVQINDISADTNCDGSGSATHGDGGTPTPTVTPVGSGGTPTPSNTPTSTSTSDTPDPDPSVPTVTPTPDASCPEAARVEGKSGSAKILDTGWTGLAHNATVVDDGVLTVALDCTPDVRPCGTCTVSGPIENPGKDQGTIDNQRCSKDPAIKCTSDADCSGTAPCSFFFGAPLPLTAGGISTCVVNEVAMDGVGGSANVETGAFTSTIGLTSRVFSQVSLQFPCPTCEGDGAANDGVAGGTCDGPGTPHHGDPCDVNGASGASDFGGRTSLDCAPDTSSAGLASLQIVLSGSSGSETLTVGAGSPDCEAIPFLPGGGFSDGKCACNRCSNDVSVGCSSDADCPGGACTGGSGGEPVKPNPCTSGICNPVGSSDSEGECATVFSTECSNESFRPCLLDSECTDGGTCTFVPRPCFLNNGNEGDKIIAQGSAGVPVNGVSNGVFAATFCIAPTTASGVNAAAGIPGPGRIELPIQSREIVNGVVAGL